MRRLLGIATFAIATLAFGAPAGAAVCDLTQGLTDSCTVAGAAGQEASLFFVMDEQPTGSGVIDPFLRIQRTGNSEPDINANPGSEAGYNTSADYDPNTNAQDFQYDQKNPVNSPDVATRNLQLFEVPIVEINGVEYREFLLDINEPNAGNQALLSLDELQIFLSPTASLGVQGVSAYDPLGSGGNGSLAGLTAIYDLDLGTGGNSFIKLDYSLNNGSGSGDMIAYIPNSLFTGPETQYVYLYSLFGNKQCCEASDGFEEWWVRLGGGGGSNPENPVPEPGTLLLVGGGLLFLGRNLRRRPRRSSDAQ